MSERYADLVGHLRAAVLGRPGVTDASVREAVAARAEKAGGWVTPSVGAEVPPALVDFVDKVAQRAFTVSQEDVDGLRRAGYSEDAIFEITASASLGAALGRLERGLAALRGGC